MKSDIKNKKVEKYISTRKDVGFMDSIKSVIEKFKGEKKPQDQKLGPISTSKEWVKDDIKRAILRHNMEDTGK